MDGMEPDSAYTRDLDNAVTEIKADEKWRREFMVLMERDREKIRLGQYSRSVAMLRMSRNRFNVDELSSIYYIDLKTVQDILDTIDAHPDWDDEQVAENVDFD